MSAPKVETSLRCRCGAVHLRVNGAPIIAAECHCASCRAAARRFAALPEGFCPAEPNGGTRFVLYRKDRVHFESGAEHLAELRLTPAAPTRRVVASCCQTPVFLELAGGHWLSLYAGLWAEGAAPPPDIRTMVGDRDAAAPVLDDAVPAGAWPTTRLYARLLVAWVAMGFRSPTIPSPPSPTAAKESFMPDESEMIEVENVASPGHTQRVNRAKYLAMRAALLAVLPSKAPGATVAEAKEALLPHLPNALFPGGDKAGWWLKAVHLDLEAKGVLGRTPKPVRLFKK